jgi:arabinosyltransferase C
VAALVAMAAAAGLPLAPVLVDSPTVDWPANPAQPRSSLLTLTAYRPLTLDARFSCRAAGAVSRMAGAGGGWSDVVLSTVHPVDPTSPDVGLIVRARNGRVEVRALGELLLDEPLKAGDCRYRVYGDGSGLTVSRDGVPLARGPSGELPDMDMLATGLDLATTPADLHVRVRVDDEFATSPTTIKRALLAALLVALAATGLGLARLDRIEPRPPRRRGWPAPRPVDLVVPGLMVLWLFLAPPTDDDGYYAAMAHNSTLSGFVGNYYQLYDQSFVPFTWFYRLLGAWQGLAGQAPVMLRIPAMVAGLIAWFAARAVVDMAVLRWPARPRFGRIAARGALGLTFLAWWLPFCMGVRPESIVAAACAVALLAGWRAIERRRAVYAFGGFAVAGLGFAAHPTGFVALAPLLAAAPGLWRMLRQDTEPARSAGEAAARPRWYDASARMLGIVAAGGTAAVAGFADGSLRDFTRAQHIFLDVQPQEHWYTEWLRWSYLLGDSPMGNYAKRVIVLVAVVALAWHLLLTAAARARDVPVPPALALTGWTLLLSFGLLSFTPSKWTHHFGALSGVGPPFLALFVLMCVPVARRVLPRPGTAMALGTAVPLVVAFALAGHGPDAWPYVWMFGFRRPGGPPAVGPAAFHSPLFWAALLIVPTALPLALRRGRPRWAVPTAALALLLIGLLLNVGYLIGSFAVATARTQQGWSLWAANLRDPLARACGAEAAVRVFDPFHARPLTQLAGSAPAAAGFAQDHGYYLGNPPIVPIGTGAASRVWGSLIPTGRGSPDRTTGRMSTPWYALPATPDADTTVGALVAGRPGGQNELTAEYAAGPNQPLAAQRLDDDADTPTWRTVRLRPPRAARFVRLIAVDGSTDPGGWLALAAPAVQRAAPLRALLSPDEPVATAWQFAFQFPCLRRPKVVDGITEQPTAAVLWTQRPLGGTSDNTWQPFRGGLFGQVPRDQASLGLATVIAGHPDEHRVEVLLFASPVGRGGYTVRPGVRISPGWADRFPAPTRTANDHVRCLIDRTRSGEPKECPV